MVHAQSGARIGNVGLISAQTRSSNELAQPARDQFAVYDFAATGLAAWAVPIVE